jgi:hypothetical protein
MSDVPNTSVSKCSFPKRACVAEKAVPIEIKMEIREEIKGKGERNTTIRMIMTTEKETAEINVISCCAELELS